MRILRLFLSPQLLRLHRELREERERSDRLEIAQRREKLRIDELAVDLERLSDRMCAMAGRMQGGGTGRPKKASAGVQLDLVSMPPAERKAALRQMIQDGTLKHSKET